MAATWTSEQGATWTTLVGHFCRNVGELQGRALRRRATTAARVADAKGTYAAVPMSRAAAWARAIDALGIDAAFVEPKAVAGCGVGLFTKRALKRGEAALVVAREQWWPYSAAAAHERAAASQPVVLRRIETLAVELGAGKGNLVKSVVHAADLARRVRPAAEQSAYLDALPRDLDAPLMWPAPLRLLLGGTSCEVTCAQQLALSTTLHDVAAELDNPPLALREFLWAQAVLLSRAHAGEGKPLALVPALDLLNHQTPPNAEVCFDASAAAFAVRALRPVDAGDELTIDYGVGAAHKLLRMYGFVSSSARGGALLALASGSSEAAASLRDAGLPTLLPLEWDEPRERRVRLPVLDAAARGVLGSALQAQMKRLAGARAAIDAVFAAGEDVDARTRRRAELCRALHEHEGPLLSAALEQLRQR